MNAPMQPLMSQTFMDWLAEHDEKVREDTKAQFLALLQRHIHILERAADQAAATRDRVEFRAQAAALISTLAYARGLSPEERP